MAVESSDLSIEALAERVGLPLRTIRFYIARGLLHGPGSRGKAAAYGEDHLLRLQLIRRLAESRMPLEEIRQRLAGLSLTDVRLVLAEEERRGAELLVAERAPSPKEYVSALLRRSQAARQGVLPGSPAAPATSTPWPSSPLAAALPGETPAPVLGETWQRWELAPGVELHVRSDAAASQRRLIDSLRSVALSIEGRNSR